jgi:alpha-L-fucosidase 2
LLPALPHGLPTGSLKGVRIRGNAELDFCWKDHQLVEAKLYPHSDYKFSLQSNIGLKIICDENQINLVRNTPNLYDFNVKSNKIYYIYPI